MSKRNTIPVCSMCNFEGPKQSFGFSGISLYISDNGFCHSSRIYLLLGIFLNLIILLKMVKTGKYQGEFIKSLIGDFNGRVIYYFDTMDVGFILKGNSLDIDISKLSEKFVEYINAFNERALKEKFFLRENNVNIVVSDIVPWVFKSDKDLNISSMLISNFTWVGICKEHLPKEICEAYKDFYRLADKALFYELYMEEMREYIENYSEVSLCSRNFDLDKADKIKKKFNNKIVCLSVGRSVDLKDVGTLKYDFIVTDGIKLKGDNVAEDRNTIKKLVNMRLAIEVDFNLEEILAKLEGFNPCFYNDY